MIQNLSELSDYIRKNVPYPKAIMSLRVQEQAGGVVFIWQGVEFLVKQSMEAFEVRGNNIYITGLSLLLQTALRKGDQEEHRIVKVIEALSDAENFARDNQPKKAGDLVRGARDFLRRMVAPK
jgi:hypothetical protein